MSNTVSFRRAVLRSLFDEGVEATVILPVERVFKAYDPDQPRDEHGRFASGGSGTGPSTATLVAQTHAHGGFTYAPLTHASPKDGVAFSPYPSREQIVPAQDFTGAHLRAFEQANADLLSQPGHCVGAWLNHDDGNVYLDVSVVTPDKSAANVQALLTQYGQLAAYDLGAGVEVTSAHPEYHQPAAAHFRTELAHTRVGAGRADDDGCGSQRDDSQNTGGVFADAERRDWEQWLRRFTNPGDIR